MHPRLRAFTLIELLVVIAIIAILAAILFPVFAQAKEAAKKTQGISNMKQCATAIVMYAGDSDDNLPNECSPNTGDGSWWWDYSSLFPAGWHTDPNYPEVEDAQAWGNAIQPYQKSLDLLDLPGVREFKLFDASWYSDPSNPKRPGRHAYNFNGLLHTYGMSAINAPSRCPLLTVGNGKLSSVGDVSSFPVMNCGQSGPCRFNGGGTPQPGTSGENDFRILYDNQGTTWTYGQGSIFVASDTSAKFRRIGTNTSGKPVLDALNDPYVQYQSGGVPLVSQGYIRCTPPQGGGSYDCFFRPDRPFEAATW